MQPPLPSTFLKKNLSNKYVRWKEKRQGPVITYDRDIICLPKEFASKNGTVKIPRSAEKLEYLFCNGLKGKIRLRSDMSEIEIKDKIRSVFQRQFKHDDEFPFDILQSGGAKFKGLVVPSLSSSYVWTAGAVAGRSKIPVYILAGADIEVIFGTVYVEYC